MNTSKVWARVILINLRNEAAPAKSQVYRPAANARLLLPGRLARGDASLLDALSGTTERVLGSKPSLRALLARERCLTNPSCGIPTQARLRLSTRSFCAYDPFSEVPRQSGTEAGLCGIRLLQPRAKRDKPAPPPARATPETDEKAPRVRRLSSIRPRLAPRKSRIAESLPCVSQSENQSQTLGGRGPGEGRRGGGGGGAAAVVQMQVGHGSQSDCRNPVTATAARTAELQPAGDPVPAGSEVKLAWPGDSAPTGPPLPCPITAGSAPARSSPHRAGKQAPPHPRGPPWPLARAGCDRYWRG